MNRKTKVICFANNKGGSGKSTTCSNVGYAHGTGGKAGYCSSTEICSST